MDIIDRSRRTLLGLTRETETQVKRLFLDAKGRCRRPTGSTCLVCLNPTIIRLKKLQDSLADILQDSCGLGLALAFLNPTDRVTETTGHSEMTIVLAER